MKLYEFTVTDEFNLPKSKILETAERSAANEAPIREWGNFKVVEQQTPERLATGEMRYYFAVEGEYADSINSDSDKKKSTAAYDVSGSAAAPEL